jgi:pimeloyl-ACP methyl ester carboxylesterase
MLLPRAGGVMCLIVPERPGFGLSDFQAGRTLLDWPDDVAALADHLGLECFGVFGLSADGPYAAACAYKIPQRLTRAVLSDSLAP